MQQYGHEHNAINRSPRHSQYVQVRLTDSTGARHEVCAFAAVERRGVRVRDQLSDSTSLLFSSVFSVGVFVVLFHFCVFSDSSEDDLFCLLHLARLFLNHTYKGENRIKGQLKNEDYNLGFK